MDVNCPPCYAFSSLHTSPAHQPALRGCSPVRSRRRTRSPGADGDYRESAAATSLAPVLCTGAASRTLDAGRALFNLESTLDVMNSTLGGADWGAGDGHSAISIHLLQQNRAAAYLTAVTLTVYVWDLLISAPQEYALIVGYRVSFVQITYFFARLCILPEAVILLVFQAGNIRHCKTLFRAHTSVFLCSAASSLLMLFRVRAVFKHAPLVVWSFILFWFTMLIYYIVLIYLARYNDVRMDVADGAGCLLVSMKPYISKSIIVPMLYDTLVYFAMSWRLLAWHADITEGNWRTRLKAMWKGTGLGRISYVLMSTGQFYYLVALSMGLATVIIMQEYWPPLFAAVTTLNFTICNIMACRVFRQLKLGIIVDEPSAPTQLRSTAPCLELPNARVGLCFAANTSEGASQVE